MGELDVGRVGGGWEEMLDAGWMDCKDRRLSAGVHWVSQGSNSILLCCVIMY